MKTLIYIAAVFLLFSTNNAFSDDSNTKLEKELSTEDRIKLLEGKMFILKKFVEQKIPNISVPEKISPQCDRWDYDCCCKIGFGAACTDKSDCDEINGECVEEHRDCQ